MAQGDAKRWFKYGCFGCLGCLGLIVVVVGMAAILGYFRAKSEKAEEQVLTHPVPAAPAAPTDTQPAPLSPPRMPTDAHASGPRPRAGARGMLILDLADAEFHIAPGEAGEPIRVEASYDKNSFELQEQSEEGAGKEWTYRVAFHRTKSDTFIGHIFQQLFSSIRPAVRVFVPPNVPIALQAKVERGGIEAELGGLFVTSAVFDVSMGGVELSVSEPLAEPMERLEMRSHMGGGEFRSIGNASPRVLEVDSRMGGIDLDLRGAWQNDSDITIRGAMGGASVRLPQDVRVEGVPGRAPSAPQSGELKVPTLRFTSSSQMGEVEFR